jgi:DNA replication protein DnaC
MTRTATSPAAELQQLEPHCQQLRLTRIAQTLPSLLETAAQQELSYRAFLETLLATEVAAKHEKHQAMRVQMARFPFHKTLDAFDWKAQPSIDPKVIKELATMRFVANGANALLLGPPEVATYYVTSLCRWCCER